MLERLGRDDEAIKYYEAARRIDPNNAIAEHRLLDLYQRAGKYAKSPGSQSIDLAIARN
jgi:hypothetical protein